jgi:hypothetical protein
MAISNSDPDMSFRDFFICAALSSSLLEASRRRYFDGGTSTQLAWLNG